MMVVAIDPGTTQSAVVMYEPEEKKVWVRGIETNDQILYGLRYDTHAYRDEPVVLVIEQIRSYGMAVGAEVFDTVFWCGRFWEAWQSRYGEQAECYQLPRRDVKLNLCGTSQAKDPNIRQALIDRFGGSKRAAIGLKASPGPLYGFRSDMWAALAVAVTWSDQNLQPDEPQLRAVG